MCVSSCMGNFLISVLSGGNDFLHLHLLHQDCYLVSVPPTSPPPFVPVRNPLRHSGVPLFRKADIACKPNLGVASARPEAGIDADGYTPGCKKAKKTTCIDPIDHQLCRSHWSVEPLQSGAECCHFDHSDVFNVPVAAFMSPRMPFSVIFLKPC